LGGVDPTTTMGFFFEVTNATATPLPQHKRRFFQFLTTYQTSAGHSRLRVSTVCGQWHSDPADHTPLGTALCLSLSVSLSMSLSLYIYIWYSCIVVVFWLSG
jgi:hypothetical protein